jgi:hypothetical protein
MFLLKASSVAAGSPWRLVSSSSGATLVIGGACSPVPACGPRSEVRKRSNSIALRVVKTFRKVFQDLAASSLTIADI